MDPNLNQTLPYLVPILVLVLVVRRSLRERKLKAERLWVMPVLLLFVGGSSLVNAPPQTPLAIAVVAVGLALGAAAGWWRGRLTHITIDPATHELTSRTSPVGVLLVAGVYALRYGLRMVELQHPNALPGGASVVADALMIFAIATMAVQRLEMWLRCQRLVAEAVKAKAG
ncbi:MAG: DUF1453 family protein [Caulobacteraceae bacterium]|nr:DUF1453 family protein [Caulobacteraceae bacterium]